MKHVKLFEQFVNESTDVNESLNKSELTYQLSIDYSGNSKPKITKLNKKEIHIKYGYEFPPEEVIKSINKIYPDIEFLHIGWSESGSRGGVHKFKINESNHYFLKKGTILDYDK